MKVNDFEWKNVKVLVTGASGFKGSWLCATLLKLGAEVYGTTRHQLNPISAYNILDLDEHIIRVEADITDRQQVYDMINSVNPNVIFHLAAKALVPVAIRDPRRTFEVNVMGTLNIIEACRKLKICERMVICSTDHVFGRITSTELPEGGFQETSRVSYGGPYDTSKAAMELAVRSYHHTYWNELPNIGITRCANVFGYGDMNQRRVIPLFVNQAVEKSAIKLKYRSNGRQFIHITDAIAGYICAASTLGDGLGKKSIKNRPENRSPFTPTFHFSIEKYDNTNEPFIRMETLANTVTNLFGSIKVDETECIDYALNENEVQALNCSKTKKSLNWEAKKSLSDALKELGNWYNNKDNHQELKSLIDAEIDFIVHRLKKTE